MMNKMTDVETVVFVNKQPILDSLGRGLKGSERSKKFNIDEYLSIMLRGGAKNDKVKDLVRWWCQKHELHLLEIDCTALKMKNGRDDKEQISIPGQIIKWPKSMIEGLEIPMTVIFLDGYDRAEPTIRRSLHNFSYWHKLYAPHEEKQMRRFDNLMLSIAAVDNPVYNYDGDFDVFMHIDVFKYANKSSVVKYTDDRRDSTPDECIREMLSHIGDDGMLYIPEWPHGSNGICSDTTYYACKMDHTTVEDGYEKVKKLLDVLMKHFQHIADKYDEIGDDLEENADLLGEKTFFIWNMSVRPFEADKQFDMELIGDISERLDYCDEFGNCMLSDDKIAEIGDCTVSKDELVLYKQYKDAVDKEAEERVKGHVCSYDILIRSMRICRLMKLKAPEFIIQSEVSILAQALVLNMYCSSMETVELIG